MPVSQDDAPAFLFFTRSVKYIAMNDELKQLDDGRGCCRGAHKKERKFGPGCKLV